jgi:hypothetical protein
MTINKDAVCKMVSLLLLATTCSAQMDNKCFQVTAIKGRTWGNAFMSDYKPL